MKISGDLEAYRDWLVNTILRANTNWRKGEMILQGLVQYIRKFGPAGLFKLRVLLKPENDKEDTTFAIGPAMALAELGDSDALGLIIRQVTMMWDKNAIRSKQFSMFLEAVRKLIPVAMQKGPLPEEVENALAMFVQGIQAGNRDPDVYETAAITRLPRFRDDLIRIANGPITEEDRRPLYALSALRHFPEMQASMLEMIGHPANSVATTAAEALVDMLGIIPGNGKKNYELWKAWAMEHVPPELRVEPPGRMKALSQHKPRLDRRQEYFWKACEMKQLDAIGKGILKS